jgi:hypothetical protein
MVPQCSRRRPGGRTRTRGVRVRAALARPACCRRWGAAVPQPAAHLRACGQRRPRQGAAQHRPPHRGRDSGLLSRAGGPGAPARPTGAVDAAAQGRRERGSGAEGRPGVGR